MVTFWSQITSIKGWGEMIQKVYEVDPMLCAKCGAPMRAVAFAINYQAVDRNIDHLKFVAEKPPPLRIFTEIALIAAKERVEYF